MPIQDIIAYIAGALILISVIPQMIKSWKTKSTKDISLWRYILYMVGILFWLIYGIIIKNNPIIAINAINLSLSSSILYLKLKYG